jgi:hypothetical protein
VPRVIDYSLVTDAMRRGGLVSLYHNSGAFGFAEGVTTRSIGWVGPPDTTIRPAARPLVRHVPPPHERNLAELAAVVWLTHLPGPAWVLPKSHWAYELDFGSREWMPEALESVGVDPAVLAPRNDGSAIQFEPAERDAFARFVEALLGGLLGSDFALAFPDRPVMATVHHHKQIWWTSADADFLDALDRLVPPAP